ncbi:zinc finger CCCH domain-containing 44-like [Olea europaea subsp. europaea]|uniref:Zinc finger CCCH domain-containing 44-like n=1 Tax=Olea europaea subsp. europaea TaxID=158383 RepID=A0A8S0U2U5_OLEEU|nr:zinc finger CCCH domain-containing 44-like [Olea europaea subsp. europaea]
MENIEALLAAAAQFDNDETDDTSVPTSKPEDCRSFPAVREMDDLQLGGVMGASGDSVVEKPLAMVNPPPAALFTGRVIGSIDKKKRGRPPRSQVAVKSPPLKRKKVEVEEDVCFICFDGGSLVLCDRKGCPKAYHPACIKRDESFFRSKAKWNCGWHICSVCQKASHYLCYTCTYSLCKGCTKDADYVCVRGNKGFCNTCMKTIMLIENKDQANNESVQVDFDDKTSWEYLFKMYWTYLKEKLSLTMSEVTQAKNPRKADGIVPCKIQSTHELHNAHDGKVANSYWSSEFLELNKSKQQPSFLNKDPLSPKMSSIDGDTEKPSSTKGAEEPSHIKDIVEPSIDENSDNLIIDKDMEKTCIDNDTDKPSSEKDQGKLNIKKDACLPNTDKHTEWASKDLLEFVAHMKNGDTTVLSQFDVQSLLLDYIKMNNLRDPRKKSQIICDLRLKNLFGKPRVGHIEMLKLLEFHFLIKDDTQKNAFIPAGFVGPVRNDMEVGGNSHGLPTRSKIRKRKASKKGEERKPETNFDEYAAIDIHNINMIYLRRNLMENLIQDKEKFQDKVIGSIVRIRISSIDQKQDIYRLVHVVGTSKVAEPYKIGDRTTDIMLEVMNLNKKEVIAIDAISNQEFSEDECRRLRQSIRCGLAKWCTVGELQRKAMALLEVRLNDILPVSPGFLDYLTLREYVEKLQLLKSTEERQRRLREIPKIHADPKMDPKYESEDDAEGGNNSKKDGNLRPNVSGFTRNGKQPLKKGKEEGSIRTRNRMNERADASVSYWSQKHASPVTISMLANGGRSDQAMRTSGSETSTATVSLENSPYANNIETEKLWHYRDPSTKIQGPFSIMQLRKWSTTGLFPPDMRIWTNNDQYDSLLLTDALSGQFRGSSEVLYNFSAQSRELGTAPDNRLLMSDMGGSEDMNKTGRDSNQTETVLHCSNLNVLSNKNTEIVMPDGTGSSGPQCWDLLNENNSSTGEVQESSVVPSSSLGQTNIAHLDRGHESDGLDYGAQCGDMNTSGPMEVQMSGGHDCEDQSNNQSQLGQSSKENVRSSPINLNSSIMDSTSDFADVAKLPSSSKQDGYTDILDLPSPTPGRSNKDCEVQTAERQPSMSSNFPMQNSDIMKEPTPTPKSNNEDQGDQVAVTEKSALTSSPAPNTGPNWGSASSLVVTGAQLPEIADEWCGYSPTPSKQFVEEWDSALVPSSSLKPPEVTHAHFTTATLDGNQLTQSPPSLPVPTLPDWQISMNEPIEFDALGEDSVSDLLAEVDAMESQGVFPCPASAMKFSKELMEDFKDDCFSSIDDFSPTPDPGKSDALSSTEEIQLNCQYAMGCKAIGASNSNALDPFRRPSVHSSASSEGETSFPVYQGEAGSEFHPPAPNNMSQDMVGTTMALGTGSEATDSGRVMVQGNINLVTVQGNVNLVLGGSSQGMTDLGWGTNQGTAWGNPNTNCSAPNGSLPWDGQRIYGGERFTGPRDWAYQGGEPGFGRGRPTWGRQPYGGGGYSRPLPKGQRVCKFYESGRCKKGAFCDYLHP